MREQYATGFLGDRGWTDGRGFFFGYGEPTKFYYICETGWVMRYFSDHRCLKRGLISQPDHIGLEESAWGGTKRVSRQRDAAKDWAGFTGRGRTSRSFGLFRFHTLKIVLKKPWRDGNNFGKRRLFWIMAYSDWAYVAGISFDVITYLGSSLGGE